MKGGLILMAITSKLASGAESYETICVKMLTFRDAVPGDLPFIVRLITEDSVVETNDDPADAMAPDYHAAFDAITKSDSNRLIVAELEGKSVGTLQLSFI